MFFTTVFIIPFVQFAQADELRELQTQYSERIKPTLKLKCGECHWGDHANAGLNLNSFQTVEQILDADRRWSKIADAIADANMPPEGVEPLTQGQRRELLTWIERTKSLIDCSRVVPGKVTIRKLNRIEYRNTIRDLLGVDYRPSAEFPGDDVGHGFDNIADVLSLPPLLMEKYLEAAEVITARAIVDKHDPEMDSSFSGVSFHSESRHTRGEGGRLIMLTSDTAGKSVRFPQLGKYSLEVVAYGDQAGDEPVKMSILLNNELIATVDVKSRRRKPSTHWFELDIDSVVESEVQVRFENDFYIPREVGRQDRNLYVLSAHVKGPIPDPSLSGYVGFEDGTDVAVATFLRELIGRAFRRPVTEVDFERFLGLYAEFRQRGDSVHQAARAVTQAVLVSPGFLYKIEQPVPSGQIRELDDYERATALSYFLWSSMPDDELLDLASEQKLSDPEIWREQIRRLLGNPRSHALVENFASQWFNLRLMARIEPDPELFPTIDPDLLRDMETETRMVVSDIFRRDTSILELLESDFTYVNQRLAEHYGLNAVEDDEFHRVSLDGSNRRGVLTHASIMTLTSNPTRTSPVKRGKWIMENILGEEPPPPLPDVVPLDDQKQLTGTLRQRMQQHRSDPSCASCHQTMDALGFALENFDAIGRFRLTDNGLDIDPVSQLPDGTTLDGPSGLQRQLKTTYKSKFVRCFTEKLLIYALGRGLKYYDRCTIDQIIERASKDDFRLSAFVTAIAESETFLKRSGSDNPDEK